MSYDINIQLVSEKQYTGNKFYSFGQKRSLGVKGLQKLVNIFAKYILTPVGSDPLDLSVGTQLTGLLGSNVAPTDAQDVLLLSVEKTVDFIQRVQRAANLPSDERLLSADVTGFVDIATAPGFAAQILIQNVLGQGRNLLLPTLEVR